MSLFNFNAEELLTFFAVLVRYGILLSLIPITGDRLVPAPIKILLALSCGIALYPMLVKSGQVMPGMAAVWGATPAGLVATVTLEAVTAMLLGFVARLGFDIVQFGGNAVGTFMGFASASLYDPHQESQSQVVAELQMVVAMLVFLAIDGHHLIIEAALGSYRLVGLGAAQFSGAVSERLMSLTAGVLKYGVQLSAPVAVSLFAVNVAFGVMAKAMPQINILVLSFSITALVGLVVLFLSLPQFQGAAAGILSRSGDWMSGMAALLGKGK